MTGEELRQAKQRLRREIRIQAARLTERYRREASERIVRQVLSLPAYRKARTVMAFVSLPGEPDTRPILEDAAAQGKTVLLPEKPLTTTELRALVAKDGIHIWNDDVDSAIYASASCVALHCATGGEKTIRLPCRAKVTMLYPVRREIAADTDRIVFTPSGNGMSTTIFRYQSR